MKDRKEKEKALHNLLRDEGLKKRPEDFKHYTLNKKYYSIVQKSRSFVDRWLFERCQNKKVMDYCCGNGESAVKIAQTGATTVVGIDISDVSIKNAMKNAEKEGLSHQVQFFVMDAENIEFQDNSFDIIYEGGVLHHLDLERAYAELARILKPDGEAICIESLSHNPIIQYYREKTPHLRTEWEADHILRKKDIKMAETWFNKVKVLGCFHLASIAAVPFRDLPGFKIILSALEALDSVLLRLPILKWQAWQVVFVLSQPKK